VTDEVGRVITLPGLTADPNNPGYFITEEGSLELPDESFGKIYWVDAFASDNEGSSAVQSLVVVVGTNNGGGGYDSTLMADTLHTVNVIDGFSRLGMSGNSGVPLDLGAVMDPNNVVTFAQGDSPLTAAKPVRTYALLATEPLPVNFPLDSLSRAVAMKLGYTIQYTYSMSLWNVTQHWYGDDRSLMWSGTDVTSSPTMTVGSDSTGGAVIYGDGVREFGGFGDDREIDVATSVQFFDQNGQLVTSLNGQTAVGSTPQTPTTWQQVKEALGAIQQLCQQFGDAAGQLFNAIKSNPDQFFNTLGGALKDAFAKVTKDPLGTLWGAVASWLQGSGASSTPNIQVDANSPLSRQVLSFLLQYSGLTVDSLQQQVLQQVGAGNIAAFEQVTQIFAGVDPTKPSSMLTVLDQLSSAGVNFDWTTLQSQLVSGAKKILTDGLQGASVQLAAKFVPGVGALRGILEGLNWLLANSSSLVDVFNAFKASIPDLAAGKQPAATAKFVAAFQKMAGVLLSGLAAQVGLNQLPQQLRKAIQFVPDQINKAITTVVGKFMTAAQVSTGTNAPLFDGIMAPPVTFQYPVGGQNYVLWVAQKAGSKPQVFVAKQGATEPIGALSAKSFSNTAKAKDAVNDIQKLIKEAQNYAADMKKAGKKGAKATDMPLSQLQKEYAGLVAAQEQVKKDILGDACKVLNGACFAAGEKLWTSDGFRAIESIKAGELVYSRNEFDPQGAVQAKVVEECFQRSGRILHLHLPDGRLIRTTPEHPFFEYNQGWVAASALKVGDTIRTEAGWIQVEEVFDTGEYETVYNLRVADFHTYFVGDVGWAVWAHNTYDYKLAGNRLSYRFHAAEPMQNLVDVAIQYRLDHPDLTQWRNVAVVWCRTAGGREEIWAVPSDPGSNHSEPLILTSVVRHGFSTDDIVALYTERSPCKDCRVILGPVKSATSLGLCEKKVFWSFDYYAGNNIASEINTVISALR
jgi:hypothetical protein